MAAYNVFGNPINNETLEAMSKYMGKQITRVDRAGEALNMVNAENKDALRYVERLKAEYGYGVSTLCLVYNATGDTVRYIDCWDWSGHIDKAPYPQAIGNGQWGAFVHVHPQGEAKGSDGGFVYRGKNESGVEYDWMCSWYNPWWRRHRCKAYTMIREVGHFVGYEEWRALYWLTVKANLAWSDEWEGCLCNVSIGDSTTANYVATLILKGAM